MKEQSKPIATEESFDIFDIQHELQLIYRKTSSKDLLTKYNKVKYFYFAFTAYVAISIPNIIFSMFPIFYPDIFTGLNKYIALVSFVITFVAIFIAKVILDYAMNRIITAKTPLAKMNRHNIPVRYLHFKELYLENEILNTISTNEIREWRSIDYKGRDKESILKTSWFIPLISVTVALAPIGTQTKIDITIFLSCITIMATLAFYVFIGVNENENIDKFLNWMKLEHESTTNLTRDTGYYFPSHIKVSDEMPAREDNTEQA
ncbi:TPA: hypothetical protein RVR74_001278 [Aeromonas salmonicida]|nr:hypothetical protein [Aeromonas salmonicida]